MRYISEQRPFVDPYGFMWTFNEEHKAYCTVMFDPETDKFEMVYADKVSDARTGDITFEYHVTRGRGNELRKTNGTD